MELIPCKANKCILYPACINKEEIYCSELYGWITKYGVEYKINWIYLRKYFKNVDAIKEPDKMNVGYNAHTRFPVSLQIKPCHRKRYRKSKRKERIRERTAL